MREGQIYKEKETERVTKRDRQIIRGRQTERQTERRTDRKTGRKTDKKTDKKTDNETDRQRIGGIDRDIEI